MNQLSYDFDNEQMELLRRMKVAQAMQEGSLAPMGPTEVVSGHAVKRSPLEAIAKVAQAYFANKQVQSINDQQRELAGRRSGELKTGVADLIEGLSATPGQATAVADESGGHSGPAMDLKGAQEMKRRAILNAVASNHPILQQLGGAQLKGLTPEQLSAKDFLGLSGYDPKSRVEAAQGGGLGALRPEKAKPMEVGGLLIDPDSMTVLQANGPVPKQVTIGGDLYEINPTTRQLKKLDNAPKITNTTNVNIPKGESKFDESFGMAEGKRASALLEARPAQIDGLEAITNGRELLKQGIHTGITANLQKDVDKVWGKLSREEPEKAARTEQFVSYIGDVVVPRLKDFGGSDTVEELKYLQKVLAGDITMEASALDRVLQSADRKMRRKIQATDQTIEEYRKKGYSLPSVTPGVQVPPIAPGSPAPGVPAGPAQPPVLSLDQYLQQRRGR